MNRRIALWFTEEETVTVTQAYARYLMDENEPVTLNMWIKQKFMEEIQ